jgi:hypothetical protein
LADEQYAASGTVRPPQYHRLEARAAAGTGKAPNPNARRGGMMKIAWMSQHSPLPEQIAELERLFGSFELMQDVNPFEHADSICRKLRLAGFAFGSDELVIVAPLSVLREICKRGIYPLRAVMERIGERQWKFLRFQRVKSVDLNTEELEVP